MNNIKNASTFYYMVTTKRQLLKIMNKNYQIYCLQINREIDHSFSQEYDKKTNID